MTFEEFNAKWSAGIGAFEEMLGELGDLIGKEAVDLAKARIGADEWPNHPDWPAWDPLSPATIEDKEQRGYPTPAPLLREGDLRDSIGYRTEKETTSVVVDVFASDEKAKFHEYGTIDLPPRPFLWPAAYEAATEAANAIGKTLVEIIVTPYSARVRLERK